MFDGFDLTVQQVGDGRGATLYTPLDSWEQRSPRVEDRRLAAELTEHLNDNLEYYHHAIWWTMDPNRRYMLLDGYVAPNSSGRSVASVVENKLIGIIGNSWVLPVAQGVALDPGFKWASTGPLTHVEEVDGAAIEPAVRQINLMDFYSPESPVPPARVSLPTRGVFAEAVLGSSNTCEKIDDSRFWRWEESPIDEPPSIESASTTTRRAEPVGVSPTAFPTPIVSIQNAPTAPDPTGVRAALDLLGKQSFADITGLAGTQANAAAAYSKALDTAYKFGKEASVLAQQAAMTKSLDRTMSSIDKAEKDGKISSDDATALRLSALKKSIGDDPSTNAGVSEAQKKMDLINDARKSSSIKPETAEMFNEQVLRELVPIDNATKTVETTTKFMEKLEPQKLQSLELDPIGSVKLVNAGYVSGAPIQAAINLGGVIIGKAMQLIQAGKIELQGPEDAQVLLSTHPDPKYYVQDGQSEECKFTRRIHFNNLGYLPSLANGLTGMLVVTWTGQWRLGDRVPEKTYLYLKNFYTKMRLKVEPVGLQIGNALAQVTITARLTTAMPGELRRDPTTVWLQDIPTALDIKMSIVPSQVIGTLFNNSLLTSVTVDLNGSGPYTGARDLDLTIFDDGKGRLDLFHGTPEELGVPGVVGP